MTSRKKQHVIYFTCFFTIRVIAKTYVQNIIKNIKQITINREKYLKMAPNDPKVQDPIKFLSV